MFLCSAVQSNRAFAPESSIVLYQTDDGQTRIECRFENESIWLTQTLMAELFQVTPQNITMHIKAIYEEGELEEAATCEDYLQVRKDAGWGVVAGSRVRREVITLGRLQGAGTREFAG